MISARKKIYVTGDSWSAGEWDTSMGDDINLHAVQYSLSNYLGETRKYEVVHNPFPGHGDGVVIAHLYDRHDLADLDYIVYVKTFINEIEIIRAINNINGPDSHSIKFEPLELGFNRENSP